jgi:hypothetical protein
MNSKAKDFRGYFLKKIESLILNQNCAGLPPES